MANGDSAVVNGDGAVANGDSAVVNGDGAVANGDGVSDIYIPRKFPTSHHRYIPYITCESRAACIINLKIANHDQIEASIFISGVIGTVYNC